MSDLFVGNVPFKAEDADLRAVFEKYGAVREARIIFDRESATSRGFAFVTFERAEDADAAFNDTQELVLFGRVLRIQRAREKDNGRVNP